MKSTSPHGWSNFATWRVYARVFDNFDLDNWHMGRAEPPPVDLADYMHAVALEHIETHIESALVRDFAFEMFSDVNWQELADHVLDAAQHEQQQELDL
jgi:hypothetical protein